MIRSKWLALAALDGPPTTPDVTMPRPNRKRPGVQPIPKKAK